MQRRANWIWRDRGVPFPFSSLVGSIDPKLDANLFVQFRRVVAHRCCAAGGAAADLGGRAVPAVRERRVRRARAGAVRAAVPVLRRVRHRAAAARGRERGGCAGAQLRARHVVVRAAARGLGARSWGAAASSSSATRCASWIATRSGGTRSPRRGSARRRAAASGSSRCTTPGGADDAWTQAGFDDCGVGAGGRAGGAGHQHRRRRRAVPAHGGARHPAAARRSRATPVRVVSVVEIAVADAADMIAMAEAAPEPLSACAIDQPDALLSRRAAATEVRLAAGRAVSIVDRLRARRQRLSAAGSRRAGGRDDRRVVLRAAARRRAGGGAARRT